MQKDVPSVRCGAAAGQSQAGRCTATRQSFEYVDRQVMAAENPGVPRKGRRFENSEII